MKSVAIFIHCKCLECKFSTAACNCDATKHTGTCAEETAICECKPQFIGENCDECASGYYSPPECKPCECSLNGTIDDTCLVSVLIALILSWHL